MARAIRRNQDTRISETARRHAGRGANCVDAAGPMRSVKQGEATLAVAKNRNPHSPAHSLAELMARYPEVQLATLVDAVPEDANWVHEIKFDGYRLLGFQAGQSCQADHAQREGLDGKFSFASRRPFRDWPRIDAVLDMEAVVLDGHGKSSFQSLQNALGEGGDRNRHRRLCLRSSSSQRKRSDEIASGGAQRKARRRCSENQQLSDTAATSLARASEMFAKACEAGLEGIISKEANAPYLVGRGRSWLKIKCSLRQEFIILGYSDPRSGERALGALYLGYRNNGALQYAGKVGTGFTMKSAEN